VSHVQVSYTDWTTVPGTKVQVRHYGDSVSLEYRDEPEPDACPEPSWWPPVQGDVFQNVNVGSRYFTVRDENGALKCVGHTGVHFSIGEFGHGDTRGGPLWRLLVPGLSRGGPILPPEGLL
jgi:hypothetical protein